MRDWQIATADTTVFAYSVDEIGNGQVVDTYRPRLPPPQREKMVRSERAPIESEI